MRILNISDIHLRHAQPICRRDEDWLGTQQKIMDWVVDEAIKRECDVILDCGDTFDTSVQPLTIINIIPNALAGKKMQWVSLLGNHSLQYHQPKNLNRSAMSTLGYCENVEVLPVNDFFESEYKNIQLVHRLIWENDDVVPFYSDTVEKETAEDLLEKYPHHNLILTGDNHHSFIFEKDGRYVVNAGCAIRQSAKLMDYDASCFIIDYDEVEDEVQNIEKVLIPDDNDLMSNDHLLKVQESEANIETFLDKVKGQDSLDLDFWVNMDAYMSDPDNDISEETRMEIMAIKDTCFAKD